MLLKIGEIEEKYKICSNTIKTWESANLIISYKTVGGHRRFLEEDIQKLLHLQENKNEIKVAVYSRVSTKKQEENLKRQTDRLAQYCKDNNYCDVTIFEEIASGLNDNRRQLHKLLDLIIKKEINILIVEYKDRLARFGVNTIIHLIQGLGCEIKFIEEKANEDANKELVDDLLSIVTSFSGRIYGSRGGRKKLQKELDI